MEIIDRIKKSSEDFINYVWPIIGNDLGGGEIIPVEGVTDSKIAGLLDTLAGVDAWQILSDKKGIRSIASRVQYQNPKWKIKYPPNTFTIRYTLNSGNNTEYYKRMYAFGNPQEGLLTPDTFVQAYLDEEGSRVLSIGIIKMAELCSIMSKHEPGELIPDKSFGNIPVAYKLIDTLKVEGGNKMLVISWANLKRLGCNIMTYG